MKIGQWQQRIVIQKNQMTRDKNDNQRNEWTDYFTCWAYVNNLSGKEYWDATTAAVYDGWYKTVYMPAEKPVVDPASNTQERSVVSEKQSAESKKV